MSPSWTAELPSALAAAGGAVLCLLGYRQYRMHAHSLGVAAFAALAFVAARRLGYPALAPTAAALGALLGYACRKPFFYVYVALGGALGGALLGGLAGILTRYSNLPLLCGATAVGGALINLLDARRVTIGWTSIVGAALIAASSTSWGPGRTPPWPSIALFACAALGGMLFQLRTGEELGQPVDRVKKVDADG